MYKVYLSPSTKEKTFGVGDFGIEEFRMNQIADEAEKALLENGKYAVFRNIPNMTKEEIIQDSNEINPNIHIVIQSGSSKTNGPVCFVKESDEVSNGFAKEIYKEIMNIYIDSSIDNGLIYNENIAKINKVKAPAIVVELGNRENIVDATWIVENIKEIGKAIYSGIEKGFKLKIC